MKNLILFFILSLGAIVGCKTKDLSNVQGNKTVNLSVSGNCGMCQKTIEKAASINRVSNGTWNKETKMLSLSYDTNKVSVSEILKRIALVGYDNQEFSAPDDAYSQLPDCCQYDRRSKKIAQQVSTTTEAVGNTNISSPKVPTPSEIRNEPTKKTVSTTSNSINSIIALYFELKDALVNDNGSSASAKASAMLTQITAIKVEDLATTAQKELWSKVAKDLSFDLSHIEKNKDPEHQREHFIPLSENLYQVIKTMPQEFAVYYQHCPMANGGKGANWLSKENAVKNPYYGAQMLTCGKTVETIK